MTLTLTWKTFPTDQPNPSTQTILAPRASATEQWQADRMGERSRKKLGNHDDASL